MIDERLLYPRQRSRHANHRMRTRRTDCALRLVWQWNSINLSTMAEVWHWRIVSKPNTIDVLNRTCRTQFTAAGQAVNRGSAEGELL